MIKEEPVFELDIEWDAPVPSGNAFTATGGCGILRVGDKVVWGNVGTSGFHWHWADLLAFLAENWGWLIFEQRYPGLDRPAFPHQLRSEAKRRWDLERRAKALDECRYLEEDEKIYWFESRHNLAQGMGGAYVPDVFVLRDKNEVLVSGEGFSAVYDAIWFRDALMNIGNKIADRLQGLADESATERLQDWQKRNPEFSLAWIKRYTGASDEFIRKISGGTPEKFFGEGKAEFRETPILVAARMAWDAQLPSSSLQKLLLKVRSQPAVNTAALDQICKGRPVLTDSNPAKNGGTLAKWLIRKLLGENPSNDQIREIDPEQLLADWKIPISRMEFDDERIDAMCCWGEKVGPIILLNRSSTRHRRESGVRTTLAHEICHLIVDRNSRFPFADVIGGHDNDDLEKRARAFAAEFLFPTALAEKLFRKEISTKRPSIGEWIVQTASRYRVSNEIVVWQLSHSTVYAKEVSEVQKNEMKRYVSSPENLYW